MAANLFFQLNRERCGPFCLVDSGGTKLAAPANVLLTGTTGKDPLPKCPCQWKVRVTATPKPTIIVKKALCEVGLATLKAFTDKRDKEGFLCLTQPSSLCVVLSLQGNNIDAAVFYRKRSICTRTLGQYRGGNLDRTLEFQVDPPHRSVLVRDVTGNSDVCKVEDVDMTTEDLWLVYLVGLSNGAEVCLTVQN